MNKSSLVQMIDRKIRHHEIRVGIISGVIGTLLLSGIITWLVWITITLSTLYSLLDNIGY